MRHQFRHQDQLVYEWEQTLDDLNIFIIVPKGIKAKQLYVDITVKHLKVGIVPNPPYLEVYSFTGSNLQCLPCLQLSIDTMMPMRMLKVRAFPQALVATQLVQIGRGMSFHYLLSSPEGSWRASNSDRILLDPW